MRIQVAILLILMLTQHGYTEILNVPEDFRSIQRAINESADGDTVLIQPGEYVENLNFEGKAITVGSLLLTTGNEAYIDSTVIDGNGRGSVVIFDSEEGENSILFGFKIQNGSANGGGGIVCQNVSPIISHCIIRDNHADFAAGGVMIWGGSPRISHCQIIDNEAGAWCGAIWLREEASVNISNSLIVGNIARGAGAIAMQDGVTLDINKCTFCGNIGESDGSITIEVGSSVAITNSILVDNEPVEISFFEHADRNELDIDYTDISGGQEAIEHIENADVNWGDGNINEDPIFVDPDEGDYHLQWGSPCINAGDPDANPDPDGTRSDMGAYPYFHGGVVEGYVLDAMNDEPLEGAVVATSYRVEAVADENGYWQIDQVRVAPFSMTAHMIGYNDSTILDLEVEPDDTLEIVFELLHPRLTPSIERITVELNQEERTDIDFSIGNDGNGLLEWSEKHRLVGESGVDPWELRRSINAGHIVDASRLRGVVFIDDLFYVSGYGNGINSIYILNMEGELVDSFPQFGEPNSRLLMRDITFDGELIWGVAGETVYGFTTAGDSITSFEGPFSRYAAIAWDTDRELLWISRAPTDIHGYDRQGRHNQEDEISRNGLGINGLAYWSEDTDGYQLYVSEFSSRIVHKIDVETGNILFVRELSPEGDWRPRGAFVTNEYDVYGNCVFMDIAWSRDGDSRIEVWQLEEPNDDWMWIEPIEGTINPGSEQELVLTLDASGLDSTLEWQGELIFSKAVGGDDTVIPVTLTIAIEDDVGNHPPELPEAFGITSVYPNPFNSMTVVNYTLPVPSDVVFKVFDLSGREILTKTQEKLSTGEHSILLDAQALSSGMYIVNLTASKQTVTRKIVLFK
jgi:hypothetical protein